MRKLLWSIIVLILIGILVDVPVISLSFNTPQIRLPFEKIINSTNINLSALTGRFSLKLGLDLQGGTQLVLQTQMDKIEKNNRDNALESAKSVIEKRVNLFGVSEALVQTSKLGEERRILVDLPGIKDASAAVDLVGKTAQLDFREVSDDVIKEASKSGVSPDLLAKQTGLTGADLKKAQPTFGQGKDNVGPEVSIEFTSEGAKKFADITKRNIGKPLAIFLDNQIVSAPIVRQEIDGGNAIISGSFTVEQAKNLSVQLNAGALPVPIKIIEQRSVGASLGQESINKSLIAGSIGLFSVMFYMVLYYGWLGLVANFALIIYSIFILAIFKTGLFILPPITLTLAGIAGFILSIGMAVDANILIFERTKEEKRWGKPLNIALEQGFKRAWPSIRDSNVSSLITAGILYFIGTGSVRGFAVALAIGVLVSMFTAVVVTRTILRLIVR